MERVECRTGVDKLDEGRVGVMVRVMVRTCVDELDEGVHGGAI